MSKTKPPEERKFQCPICKGHDNHVWDSRKRPDNTRYRLYKCKCGYQFETREVMVG